MSLGLGELIWNKTLDNFLLQEGYEAKERRYHVVISCWCGSGMVIPLPDKSLLYDHYLVCEACGCLVVKYCLPVDDLKELYGARYFREHQLAIGLPPYNERFESDALDRIPVWIDVLKRHFSKGKLLEVGCAHGRFLQEASKAGFDVVGLELDEEICQWAKEKTKCDIRCAAIDDIENEHFDIVFANDILEHLYNPREFVRSVMNTLRYGGVAIFQTVVFQSWEGCPGNMLRPLFHPILYSRRSLDLLVNSGSGLVSVSPGAFDCFLVTVVKT